MIRSMRNELNCWVSVISAGRPKNVAHMTSLIGPATWYVPADQVPAYQAAGAVAVSDNGGLCPARNRSLQDAFSAGVACIQLSDDLKRLESALGPKATTPLHFADAVVQLANTTRLYGAKLGGIAPVANAFYFNPKRPVHQAAFILGDFLYVLPSKPRFDERLRLKEDYDFTLQHITTYGGVARCNDILGHFAHRTNAGGACTFRNAEREQEAIALLKAKWPGMIVDNPRRPNEILLKIARS